MKKFFWALLLANVVFFTVMKKGWLSGEDQFSIPQPALHADMIRLIDATPDATEDAPPEIVPKAKVATIAPSPIMATSPDPNTALVAKPDVPIDSDQISGSTCLEWGEFTGQDLELASAALSSLQLGKKLSQYQVEHDVGYWVYIPPLQNKAAVNRKIQELKVRGINEYFVVQDTGKWRYAISLGVFKTEDAAQHFLKDLQVKRDVHTAVVGQRASKFNVTVFRLNGVGILTEVKLTALQKQFAGSELKRIPCTLTK